MKTRVFLWALTIVIIGLPAAAAFYSKSSNVKGVIITALLVTINLGLFWKVFRKHY